MKKEFLPKVILALTSLLFVEASQASSVYASKKEFVGTSVAPVDFDIDTLANLRSVLRITCGESSDIMAVAYHEEAQVVDLSSFDAV